jgi:hypothetical protein
MSPVALTARRTPVLAGEFSIEKDGANTTSPFASVRVRKSS